MILKSNSEQARIMLPPMTVSYNGVERPIMINPQFCRWLKRMFFEFDCFTCSKQCSVEEDITRVVTVFGAFDFKEMTNGQYEFPSEFKNIVWHTFKQGVQILTVVVIPLDAIMKECDCNMIGFFKEGDRRIMYTGEYYSGLNEFKLCCFDDMGRHMSFRQSVETIEEFKDAIFKLNAK